MVTNLQAEVVSNRRKREEEVAYHEHQLSNALAQQQKMEEELKAARVELKDIEGERAALELRVHSLQAEVEDDRRKREEEVAYRGHQLSDAMAQWQKVEEEVKAVKKEMVRSRRGVCGGGEVASCNMPH